MLAQSPLSIPLQIGHKPVFGAEACLLTLLDDIPAVANLIRAVPKKPANSGVYSNPHPFGMLEPEGYADVDYC